MQHCDVLSRRLGKTSVGSEWVPDHYNYEMLKSKSFANCNMLCAENSEWNLKEVMESEDKTKQNKTCTYSPPTMKEYILNLAVPFFFFYSVLR